jgi:predicted PurR-regulated permease PerM
LEAYLIFPFAVGGSLKINTLVIMVVILVGGMLWGGAGMILFIPFVSILKLIADRTEGLETLAILLGEGKTKNKEGT